MWRFDSALVPALAMTRLNRWRAALVLLATLASLAAVELGLRVVGDGAGSGGLRGLHQTRPDTDWLYGLRAGAHVRLEEPTRVDYQINEDGWRDRRYSRDKPPGVFRIVVLGDSVAFGYGVAAESTFPFQLEELAAKRTPEARIEVLNLGVGGYNPYNEAALFTDVGVGFQPDLVLIQFCINDLNDPTLHFDASTQQAFDLPDLAFPNPSTRNATEEPGSWCSKSRLCDWVRSRTKSDFDRQVWLEAFAPRDRDTHDVEWLWLAARYNEIAEQASRIGARVAVVAFPYPAQLDGQADANLQRRLNAIGRSGGWQTIDLLPAFRDAAGGELFLDLWHPTELGHEIAAQQILDALACDGLLSASVACTQR
jgi:lysophospholipase L1-like esterase